MGVIAKRVPSARVEREHDFIWTKKWFRLLCLFKLNISEQEFKFIPHSNF